mmetsp:Transcript_32111/g.49108  ORF Transcript_32111/g.49108 Transcript_32111/m.49108 type:complete len:285 (-) Transcript_32111:167-1021(-)
MLLRQSFLEDKFNSVCVEDGMKMTPLTDEYISEEARSTALELKSNTAKLMRAFTDQEKQLKLKSFEHKSSEFAAFSESFGRLERLMEIRVTTPMEEVNSIRENLRHLQTKTQNLTELRDTKKDAYLKYMEECSKSKDIRKAQIDHLKQQIGQEKNNRSDVVVDFVQKGLQEEEMLKANHTSTVEALEKQIRTMETELKKVLKSNSDEEAVLRKEFKKASNEFENNVKQYDYDVSTQTIENKKTTAELDDTIADLSHIKEDYASRQEEKRKRDEIAALMKRKSDE